MAGSASPDTAPDALNYAHDVIRGLVSDLASRGAIFVVQVGKEPRIGSESDLSPAIIFDWTALEVIGGALSVESVSAAGAAGGLVASVCTHKTEAQVPPDRRCLWDDLIRADAVCIEHIEGDWTSGAVRRERQAQIGDVLVAVSGGEGVEHLAQLYAAQGKPVIPLDLNLGSSSGDGKGGSSFLNKEALSHPDRFFRLTDPKSGVALLSAAGTRNHQVAPSDVAQGVIRLMAGFRDPEAFYVRLLNPKVDVYAGVEDFFRKVVDPVIDRLGYAKAEMGDASVEQAFMNVEIFERIHHAAIVVVDLTGVRPNCMMELGYALGRLKRVIVTAQDGTHLPFDPGAIDTHLWRLGVDDVSRQAELAAYCARAASRPPLVRPRGWT